MAKRIVLPQRWWCVFWAVWVGVVCGGSAVGAAPSVPSGPALKVPKSQVNPWQKLFADEDWYKQGPPQEMIIRGQLEAVAAPKGPTILMRTYFYRLRQWNLYTGGKRIKLLDRFVGQEVEILGKEVKMSLEGQELLEFWPAAIRPALPHPKWPKPKTPPPVEIGPGGLQEPGSPGQPTNPTEPSQKEPKSSSAKPDEPAWQKLFADEEWYKQAEGKEQIFRGRLEAVPQGPAIGFLMRTWFYRLGQRSIYTGARKLEVLDRLVGQEVEILGKAVDMALEGRQVKEIWPAAVRPVVGQPPSPPAQKPPPMPEKPNTSAPDLKDPTSAH
jgi:hypothetical protein